MKKNQLVFIPLLPFLLLSLSANAAIKIVTSVKPLQLVAEAIVGDLGSVQTLIPDGSTPHHYSLSPSDREKLEKADLIIRVGSGLEPFLDKPLSQLNKPILNLVPIEQANIDPHVWMSPIKMLSAAADIQEILGLQFPEKQQELERNYQRFTNKLLIIDKKIKQQLAAYNDKSFIVFHDAFGRFIMHYQLGKQVSLTLDPEQAVGAKRIAYIQQLIKDKGIQCMFVEPQFKTTLVKRMVEESNLKLGYLDPLATQISKEQGYSGYLQSIADSIENCLVK